MNTRLFVIVDNTSTNLIHQSENAHTVELELFDDVEIPLTLQVADVRDISKKNTSHSLNFDIPASEINRNILESTGLSNFVEDPSVYEKMLLQKKYNCIIQQDSRDVFTGVLVITNVNKTNGKTVSYSCCCESRVSSFFRAIANKTFLGNDVWSDISHSDWNIPSEGMTPARFSSLYCYNTNTNTFELPSFDKHLGFAAVDRFYKAGQKTIWGCGWEYIDWRSYELTPYVFIQDILDKMIKNAGYNWVSNFFGHTLDIMNPWDESRSWLQSRQSDVLKNICKFNPFEMVMPSCKNMNTPRPEIAYIRHKPRPGGVSWDDDTIHYFKKNLISVGGYDGIAIASDDGSFWHGSAQVPIYYNAIPDYLTGARQLYTATQQGWYRLNTNFNWKCVARFYDGDGTNVLSNTGIRYRLDNAIGNYEDGSYVAYNIQAEFIKVSNGTTTLLKTIYQNYATGKSMCQFLTGFNRRLGHTDADGYIVFASSEEYEEGNSGKSDTSEYGLTYNKPIVGDCDVYLMPGDKVGVRFIIGIRTGVDALSFTTAYETYGDVNCRLQSIHTEIGQSYNGGDLFSVEKLDSIGPGDGINYNDILPADMKQTDFLQSLCRMFNLYIEDVSLKPDYNSVSPLEPERYMKYPRNTLRIEPRDVYYTRRYQYDITPGTVIKKDWTDKIDISTVTLKTPSDYINKNIKFNYKDDSSNDFMVKNYNDRYPIEKLGSYLYKSEYNSDEVDNIDTSFAASEYGEVVPGKGSEVMYAFGANNGVVESNKTITPRIMFRCLSNRNSEEIEISTEIGNLVTLEGAYATLSNYKFSDRFRGSSIADLSFGLPEYTMMKNSRTTVTTNNLFNAFYFNELNNIASVNSRLMCCKAYLTPKDIESLQLSDEIVIDSIVYHINKISGWKSEKEPCDCEFIKVLPDSIPTHTSEQIRYDGSYNIGVISQDSKGNTIINNNTTIVGGEGGGGSYTLTQNRENIYLMSGGQVVSNVTVPDMVGATSGVSGKNGLVPAPTTADRTKFLKGDGTWDNDSYTLDSTDGISVSLYRNGTLIDTVPIETFLGADAQNVGTPGLVPTAQVNDRFKFLRGDGTWQPAGGSGSYEIENDPHDSMVINLKSDGVVSSYANIPEYEACSQQYPGEYGAVHPAPQGAMDWYFGGDAQWRPIPTEAYVLQFTKHANIYTLESGNYAGAVSALNAGKPVFAILNDEDSSQDGDKIVYGDAHWDADDTTIILHLHPNDSTELYLELYDDNSFDFYSNTVRNFGRLTVNGSSYQSSAPNTTLTLNDGTGISLNRTNATVTFNLKQATDQTLGGIKVSSTAAPGAGSMATSGMRRPVQVDSNGNASVLVDYQSAGAGLSLVNNAFVLNQATDQTLGGIKVSSTPASQIGSVAQGTVRPVQLDANGVAGVAIPDVTFISPLMDTGNGITCKAADIDDTPYRKGLGCLDYTEDYVQRAGCVTPMAVVDTDENGEEAIKSWKKIDGAYIQPMGSFYFAAPKSGAEFYALPITMIRTKDGPVPVLLVNRDIYRMLNNYILNETPVVVSE